MPVKPTVAQRPQDDLILEDREVVLTLPEGIGCSDPGNHHCIVAGCIRSVGITLVDSKDTTNELYCLNRSMYHKHIARNHIDYDDMFNAAQDKIINGRLNYMELYNELNIGPLLGASQQAPCSFK